MDEASLRRAYADRRPLLVELSSQLEVRMQESLKGLPHIDRISFRAKTTDSFMEKALRPGSEQKPAFTDPLREIEDQIAGRVLVFFRDDMDLVTRRLASEMGPVEAARKEPEGIGEFGYESDHSILVIPAHLKPEGWNAEPSMPVTFEMQVRTLFMHAWAEPQHDLGYKQVGPMPRDVRRRLAWIASSAWGADNVINELQREVFGSAQSGSN